MSSFFTINSLIGKGIEPHPTDGYHSVSFLTTLRLMLRTLSRHLVMPCGSSRFVTPLSTQHNYYIKTLTICQVFFNLFFIFFLICTPTPSCAVSRENLLSPAHLLSKTTGRYFESSQQPVRLLVLLLLQLLQSSIQLLVQLRPVCTIFVLWINIFVEFPPRYCLNHLRFSWTLLREESCTNCCWCGTRGKSCDLSTPVQVLLNCLTLTHRHSMM